MANTTLSNNNDNINNKRKKEYHVIKLLRKRYKLQ